jgi:hypothetical protein
MTTDGTRTQVVQVLGDFGVGGNGRAAQDLGLALTMRNFRSFILTLIASSNYLANALASTAVPEHTG